MKNIFMILIGFILSTQTLNAKENFYGKWIIKEKISKATGVSTLSNEDINSFLGKTVEYSANFAKFDTEKCNSPQYKKTIISKNDFLTSERISFSNLDIKTKNITMVEVVNNNGTHCLSVGGLFYIKNKDSIITNINGTYFLLKRI